MDTRQWLHLSSLVLIPLHIGLTYTLIEAWRSESRSMPYISCLMFFMQAPTAKPQRGCRTLQRRRGMHVKANTDSALDRPIDWYVSRIYISVSVLLYQRASTSDTDAKRY